MREIIAKMDLFSGLDEKLQKKVAETAVVCQFSKDEVIVREGELGLGLYVVLRGRVAVTKLHNGVEVQIAELGPEQFFAEMSIIDDKPRSATVRAMENTECMLLTRDSSLKLMKRYPEVSIRLARVLAERLRVAGEQAFARPATEPAAAAAGGSAAAMPVSATTNTPPSVYVPNGDSPTTKARVQKQLLDTFQKLYMVKAFTRFSVALLGCPVEGIAPNTLEEFRVGEVKVLVFPADQPVDMTIDAYGAGSFDLHFFSPGADEPVHFGPHAIQPLDRFRFSLNPSAMTLRRDGDECVQEFV